MAKLPEFAAIESRILAVRPLPCAAEPCLTGTCRSPSACNDWGYCRERNMADKTAPTAEQIAERRQIAKRRRFAAAYGLKIKENGELDVQS